MNNKMLIVGLIVLGASLLTVIVFYFKRKEVWESDTKPFESSGCTGFPDSVFGINLNPFCVMHDRRYRAGGGFARKFQSDITITGSVFLLAAKLIVQAVVASVLVVFVYCGLTIGGALAFHWRSNRTGYKLFVDIGFLLFSMGVLYCVLYGVAIAIEWLVHNL